MAITLESEIEKVEKLFSRSSPGAILKTPFSIPSWAPADELTYQKAIAMTDMRKLDIKKAIEHETKQMRALLYYSQVLATASIIPVALENGFEQTLPWWPWVAGLMAFYSAIIGFYRNPQIRYHGKYLVKALRKEPKKINMTA